MGMPDSRVLAHPGARYIVLSLGWVSLVLGVGGLPLPFVPSMVCLGLALWAFSRSSPRFHLWLYSHPRLGGPLRDWHAHRVIPPRAKVACAVMMALSLAYIGLVLGYDRVWLGLTASALAPILAYVLTRSSRPPA